jgi:diacylglycerol kinase family enzyme
MARELDIPLDIDEALKILQEGTTKKADLIPSTTSYALT